MIRCKTTLVLGRKGAKVLRMKISEMITDRYKLRIPPTVYYDLLADVQEVEEEQEPTTKNDLAVDKLLAGCEKMSFEIEIFNKPLRVVALDAVKNIVKGLPSVTPQEPILDELRAEITTLQNRCYALTKGTMCAFCKYECEYKAESEPQESEVEDGKID